MSLVVFLVWGGYTDPGAGEWRQLLWGWVCVFYFGIITSFVVGISFSATPQISYLVVLQS